MTRAAALLAVLLAAAAARAAPAMADGEGEITTWIWHFDGEMRVACVPAYRGLLRALPRAARIVVGVTTAEDARVFRQLLELDQAPDPRIRFVEAGESVSGWARDRYILFGREGQSCLLLPRGERVPGPRRGDVAVARELQRLEPSLSLVESDLIVDGGNVLVTPAAVIAGPDAVLVNVEPGGRGAAEVQARLEEVFGRRLVITTRDDSPLATIHADMYLAVAGARTLLLGDPRLGAAALPDGGSGHGFGVFRRERQEELAQEYDRIAERLAAEDFDVHRLPILHADDGVILTWTNAVVDERDGTRRVYLPEYGLEGLDRAAQEAWRARGFEPVPIDVEGVIVLGGGVRCLTNVVRTRAEAPGDAPAAAR